jgi:hypothetical protein
VHAFAFAPDGSLWLYRAGELSQLVAQADEWVLRRRYGAAEGIEVEKARADSP